MIDKRRFSTRNSARHSELVTHSGGTLFNFLQNVSRKAIFRRGSTGDVTFHSAAGNSGVNANIFQKFKESNQKGKTKERAFKERKGFRRMLNVTIVSWAVDKSSTIFNTADTHIGT